ncbi:MAG TPA: MATE family efflux transporter [Treponemataceae bacterium]|nr:MATE family efflux transporter [Treponemataceae bacterium]
MHKKFGSWPFYKKALLLALPVMAQLLIQNLVSLIDNFMVAGLGDIKMSGVNVAGQFNMIYLVLTHIICLSGGIFMSQYNGAKAEKEMKHVFRFKLIVLSLVAIIYALFCSSGAKVALNFMVRGNTNAAEIVSQGSSYMRLLAFSWLPLPIAMAISTSMRETGRVKVPLYISVFATLVNTFFNWVLIYGNLGAPRLEVEGAAIATIIARGFEALAYIVYCYKKRPPFFIKLCTVFKVRLSLFKTILSKSGLILVSEMSWILVETFTASIYNGRGGAEVVSGMSAGFAISHLFTICISGVQTAIGVQLGGTLGAGKLEEAREHKIWFLNGAIVFGIIFGALSMLGVFIIPFVFVNLSEGAQSIARYMVLITAAYIGAWCYLNALLGIARTGGDTLMGATMDVSINVFVVFPAIILLAKLTSFGPVVLYAIVKSSDFIKIAYAKIWLRNERWIKNLTNTNSD